ncbi:MAG TPA: hypothetical protein VF756_32395 [Thermoanaerobaculia bacterium]
MTRSTRRAATAAVLLLTLALPAATQAGQEPARSAHVQGIFDLLWKRLAAPLFALWEEGGLGMDPNGGSNGDQGIGMDPDGSTTDGGPGMDPDGSTTDGGPGMDPNGEPGG